MNQPAFPASRVVFDLDGTLVDTAPDLSEAMNHVLVKAGRPPVPPETVRHMVGRGARRLIEAGLEATGGRLDPASEAALLEQFLDHYRANIAVHSRPFPGAETLLERLGRLGIGLGLCTNKPQALTEALLEALSLARHFAAIAGGDALDVRKPDPRHLAHVLDRLGGDGPALMIGDTAVDVAAAQAAGVPVIVVDFGYSEEAAHGLGADAVVSGLSALGELIGPA